MEGLIRGEIELSYEGIFFVFLEIFYKFKYIFIKNVSRELSVCVWGYILFMFVI